MKDWDGCNFHSPVPLHKSGDEWKCAQDCCCSEWKLVVLFEWIWMLASGPVFYIENHVVIHLLSIFIYPAHNCSVACFPLACFYWLASVECVNSAPLKTPNIYLAITLHSMICFSRVLSLFLTPPLISAQATALPIMPILLHCSGYPLIWLVVIRWIRWKKRKCLLSLSAKC